MRSAIVWRLASFAVVLSLCAGVSYCLLRKPLTLHDGLDPIVKAQQAESVSGLFWSNLRTAGYVRPLRFVQVKLLYDAFEPDLFRAFAGFHVALTVATVLLLGTLLLPTGVVDFVATAVAGVTLFGLHTSGALFFEAFPINHFLEIVCLLLLALVATVRCRGWAADGLAFTAVLVGLGTLESGVLVWLALVTAWGLGWRRVSRSGLAASCLLLMAYFAVRLFYLDLPAIEMDERSSGFGFQTLDPAELVARFDQNPWPFYLYNVTSSWLSVLFAEPRAGVWVFTGRLLQGEVPLWMWINLITSGATSGLIITYSVRRCSHWVRGEVDDGDRFVLLFWMILAANGVVSYAYTKDVVLSAAGVLYACAAFAVFRDALGWVSTRSHVGALAVTALLVVVSIGWSVRTVGLVHGLRLQAYRQANDWAFIHPVLRSADIQSDPETVNLVLRLRRTMINKTVPAPFLAQNLGLTRWLDQNR